jgi:hypothetical protein
VPVATHVVEAGRDSMQVVPLEAGWPQQPPPVSSPAVVKSMSSAADSCRHKQVSTSGSNTRTLP